VLSCGTWEAPTSRIVNRICLEYGKRNNIKAGFAVSFLFRDCGIRIKKRINM